MYFLPKFGCYFIILRYALCKKVPILLAEAKYHKPTIGICKSTRKFREIVFVWKIELEVVTVAFYLTNRN